MCISNLPQPPQYARSHSKSLEKAKDEDDVLGGKISNALVLEKEGMDIETAVLKIGNDVSVFQTLQSLFPDQTIFRPSDLLTVAAHAGGNTDTIGLVCGAYLGASQGIDALPSDLLEGLEDRQRIELLGQRLHSVYQQKLVRV